VEVTSGDLVESLVTITTQGSLAQGDQVELGASSSTSSSSSSGSNNRQQQGPGGGGILVPGPGGPGG
jgi:hypothetical protein